MVFRNECRCSCHLPNVNMRHMFPCCEPDPIPGTNKVIQPDYANPSSIQILRGAPNANWRKCWDCGSESLHMDNKTPWVLCQHCKSQDTRLMKNATELLRKEFDGN